MRKKRRKKNGVIRAKSDLLYVHTLPWMEKDTEMNKLIQSKVAKERPWPSHAFPIQGRPSYTC